MQQFQLFFHFDPFLETSQNQLCKTVAWNSQEHIIQSKCPQVLLTALETAQVQRTTIHVEKAFPNSR